MGEGVKNCQNRSDVIYGRALAIIFGVFALISDKSYLCESSFPKIALNAKNYLVRKKIILLQYNDMVAILPNFFLTRFSILIIKLECL